MTDPIEHQFNQQPNQPETLSEEGLNSVMGFNTIQESTNSTEQKDPPQQTNEQNITETGNQQLQFEQQIEIPYGFDDPYYQTILTIYAFFNQTVPITTIMNAIHQAAGDVTLAVQRISQNNSYKYDEPCDFSYQKIYAPKEKIEQYFSF
ncbi:AT hook motif family protein [Histomonas meleagridis]|uniref:AT hook motif family protein n=1 Tax=Histomonas meleagridis TaxID=135588 RepID=UPI00355A31A1|nr:AT hook motif family protein [Histomonas meleagridis]